MKQILLFFIAGMYATGIRAQYSNEIKIEKLLKTDSTEAGQHISYPHITDEEVTMLKVTIPPGKSTGWHKHLYPVFAYVLQGTLTVQMDNNRKARFKKNSSVAESINKYHTGMNERKEPLVLIAFYMGEKDKPVAIKKE
jgi:quercetin dioxygenase-like cupin family protein